MAEFHFLRPQLLLGLLPLLLVWWALWRGQDSYAQLKKVVAPHLLEHLVVGGAPVRRLRPVHLLSAVWILAALALAGPAWERESAPFADDDAGLVVLLKVSGTMQAADVQPARSRADVDPSGGAGQLQQGLFPEAVTDCRFHLAVHSLRIDCCLRFQRFEIHH